MIGGLRATAEQRYIRRVTDDARVDLARSDPDPGGQRLAHIVTACPPGAQFTVLHLVTAKRAERARLSLLGSRAIEAAKDLVLLMRPHTGRDALPVGTGPAGSLTRNGAGHEVVCHSG